MEYKWKAFSVVSIGALMAAIDSTVVLLALVPIAHDLGSSYVTVIWIVIAYLLATTALVLSLGRIADIYGRKRMYNTGFVVFTVGSLLCGLATSGVELDIVRGVQGMGAALLTANSFAILSEAFPPNERGKAFGSLAIVWGFGSILGVLLGGVIIAVTTWRVIFLINVPIGLVATWWAYRVLHESKAEGAENESFDLPAATLFTLALVALLVGITFALIDGWTWPGTLLALALVPVLFAAFAFWEVRFSHEPIIDFSAFRNRTLTFGIVASLFQSIGLFSVNFLLVFYLEGIDRLSALTASYLIIPSAIGVALVGPIGGRLADRYGARTIGTIGIVLQTAALLALSELTAATPISTIALIEAVFGIGGGLFWPANTAAIMSNSPRNRFGVGSGLMNTFRNTGMVVSLAVTLVTVTAALGSTLTYLLFVGSLAGGLPPIDVGQYLAAQRISFEVSAGLMAAAAVMMSLIASRPAASAAPRDAPPPAARASS